MSDVPPGSGPSGGGDGHAALPSDVDVPPAHDAAAGAGALPAVPVAPVTLVVARLALPGHEAELEAELRHAVEVAARFPGHQGAQVYRPFLPDQPEHVLVFRFDSRDHLRAWNDSDDRRALRDRLDTLTDGSAHLQAVTGMEGWFALPGQTMMLVPPRWKIALVTGAAIYLLMILLTLVAGPLLARLPLPLRALATVTAMVTLMTWVVMPNLTRLLRPWLLPSRRP